MIIKLFMIVVSVIFSKQHRDSFNISTTHASNIFDLVHMDTWGSYHLASLTGAYYFLTLVDDCSRSTWTYLISNKGQIFGILLQFGKLIQTQFNKTIKVLRSNNDGEFINSECKSMFKNYGIISQRSVPYTPHQNGVVERKHRHLL